MNEYEEKQAARKARYEAKAERLEHEASGFHNQARDMASVIPLGQPILVGHHSEGRDRNYRRRIGNKFDKAAEAHSKAAHYAGKAHSVGKGGISSDDPDAVEKLRVKLAHLVELQDRMKTANRLLRKGDIAALVDLVGETVATDMQVPDFAGRLGFPGYALTNNNANIRRIKQRIESLAAAAGRETSTETVGEVEIIQNADANRVQIFFPGKPSAEVRGKLKGHGFRWARSEGAWQRHLTDYAVHLARQIASEA